MQDSVVVFADKQPCLSAERRGFGHSPRMALSEANATAAYVMQESDVVLADVRGVRLYNLRKESRFLRAELATAACISLRQLYQLETGQAYAFYSASHRDIAGRRVCAILGCSWDKLDEEYD